MNKSEVYKSFEFLYTIKRALAYNPFETTIEKASKLTLGEYYEAINKGISPDVVSAQKLENFIAELSLQRKRDRDFLINNGDVLSKSPSFNKRYIEDPDKFESTYTNVFFHGKPTQKQMNRVAQGVSRMKWSYARPWNTPSGLEYIDELIRHIENAGQVAKNVVILMDYPQVFKSLDNLIKFHRVINKLQRNRRNIIFLDAKLNMHNVRTAFIPAYEMTLENPKYVSQMHHYINENTQVNLEVNKMPTLAQFGGFIPHYNGPQSFTDAEHTQSGHKVVATRDAEKRDYNLQVTHTKLSCDCSQCPRNRETTKQEKCAYVNEQQVTELVHREYHQEEFIHMTEYIDSVQAEQDRLIANIERSAIKSMKTNKFSYEDKIDLLKYFGMYTFAPSDRHLDNESFDNSQDRLENEQMFVHLTELADSEDIVEFIDYEVLANYDRKVDFTYEVYDFGKRRYHYLLNKLIGKFKALEVHTRLNTWKFNHNKIEYFGDVNVMSAQ